MRRTSDIACGLARIPFDAFYAAFVHGICPAVAPLDTFFFVYIHQFGIDQRGPLSSHALCSCTPHAHIKWLRPGNSHIRIRCADRSLSEKLVIEVESMLAIAAAARY